tara:strand:+ start:8055 stop:9326 length:1272 start_codon:yes stop_codon:yes gene_type:complete
MAIVQGRTRAQLRQSIGYNLGATQVSSASGTGSNTTIVDNTLVGGDDNHIGKWVVFNDVSTSTVEISRVSDYVASTTTLTVSPAFAQTTVANDTYELWDDIYPPLRVEDFINQSILDATGHAYDPVESLALHTDGKTQRFDIPSGLSMIQNLYYRSKVDYVRLLSCNSVMDENVDSDFTVTADTKMKKQGTASNRIVIADGASAGDIVTDSITSKDISEYDYVEFWIRSSVATSAGNLKILLDDTANCATPTVNGEVLSVPSLSADTWTFCRVALSNPEDDTAIISVGLEYDSDLGACTVWLDDISVVKNDSAQWDKLPRNLWKIDKQEKDVVIDNYAHGLARYNLLKIVGGDKPALLTADTDTSELDEQYIISRSTALAFASASGGPATDPDNKNNMAGFWMGMSQQAKRQIPFLTDIRLVE